MGNGCWSGRSLRGTHATKREDFRRFKAGAMGSVLVLLFAAFALVWPSPSRDSQAASPIPAAPFPGTHHSFTDANAGSPNGLSLNSLRKNELEKPDAQALLGQLPLIFEPNQGQADAGARFLAHGKGFGLSLEPTQVVLGLRNGSSARGGGRERLIRMKLVGANRAADIAGTGLLAGKSNYFIGGDPHRWHSGIPQFSGVHYKNIYSGIDLVFYGSQGHLEYDFHVAPGADPAQAELQFEGAGKLEIKDGDLLLAASAGAEPIFRMRKPEIYQREGNRRKPIDGHFVLHADNRVSFQIEAYDRERELVIDPALVFSSYFGEITSGTRASVAVNGDGYIYLSGSTTSDTGFPTAIAATTLGTTHVFVAKINPASPPSLVYLTFLGGNGTDTSMGLGVDLAGNTYVAGNTTSTGTSFPTTSLAYQTSPLAKGSQCASVTCTSLFVSAINSTGSALNYSSYVSGNGNDVASGVAIDASQDVFITGTTTSNNVPSSSVAFPATLLPVPFQSAAQSTIQFFVTKVNTTVPGVGGIAYSTYFGGSLPSNPIATGGGITVDSTGNIYFSGTTNFYNSGSGLYGNSGTSGDFPILNSYQPCLDTIPPVTLLNPNPCTAPATPYPSDGFMAKINPLGQSGAQLLYSTYLGGTGTDTSTAVAIDSTYVYITGSTNSSDLYLPPTEQAYQSCLNNPGIVEVSTASCPTTNTNTDAYIARFTNPSLSTTGVPNFVGLSYFSYLGGSGNESGNALTVDTANDALVTGYTTSTNFPFTTGSIQTVLNGAQNSFFAHINTNETASVTGGSYATYFGGNGTDNGTSIAVDISLNTYFAGSTTSATGTFQVPDALQSAFNSPGPDAFVVKLGTQSDLCINCVTPVVSPNGIAAAGNQVTITYTVSNNGPDVATGVNVLGQVPSGVTFDSASVSGSSSGTAGGSTGTCSAATGSTNITCQIPTLQAGSAVNVTFVVTPLIPGTFETTATVSDPTNTNTNNTATASFVATSFTVAIAPSSQTVAAGQSAQYNVVVAPTQGVFGANVSLTCSSLPTGATCNFATSTINLSSGEGSSSTVLNVATTAQPVPSASTGWHHPLYAFWLAVPGMAFLGLGGVGKTRRRTMLLGLIALMVFFTMTLLQPACSTPKTLPTTTGTPSGVYPLTVNAASGSLTKTVSFTLSVIP